VKAQLQPVLFQRTEEILEGVQVEEGKSSLYAVISLLLTYLIIYAATEDHIPTAERIEAIFSPQSQPRDSFFFSAEDDVFASINDNEAVLTVDFNSLGTAVKRLEKTHVDTKVKKEDKLEVGAPGRSDNVDSGTLNKTGQGMTSTTSEATTSTTSVTTTLSVDPGTSASPDTTARGIRASRDPAIFFAGPTIAPGETYVPGFTIDVTPTPVNTQEDNTPILSNRVSENAILGQTHGASTAADDDEVIVYDAPFPLSASDEPPTPSAALQDKSNRAPGKEQLETTPKASTSSAFTTATASLSFSSIAAVSERNRQQYSLYTSPRGVPRRITKLGRRAFQARGDKDRQALFNGRARSGGTMGAIAAMLEERQLHDEDDLENRPDPRKQHRRVGDSDLDWGDTTDGEGSAIEKLSSDLGGMDIDPDVDEAAYGAFVKRMAGVQAGEHVTIDDLEDMERLRKEDESDEAAWRRRTKQGEDDSGSDEVGSDDEGDESADEELEAVLQAEERALIAEPGAAPLSGSDDDDDDDSEDEDETPRRGFKKRLERVRARSAADAARGIKYAKGRTDDDEDEEDAFDRNLTWAEKDDDYVNMVQVC
jgi:hypothetical protein